MVFTARPADKGLISNQQAFNDTSMDEVFLDDFVYVIIIHVGIPYPFRINGYHRPLAAAIHTSGGIDPDAALARQAKYLDPVFCVGTGRQGIEVLAAGTAIFTLVGAKKYVITIIRHVVYPVDDTRSVTVRSNIAAGGSPRL
jgi:hypothetical protein